MRRPRARAATSRPMVPKPTMPSTLPATSTPSRALRSQRPSRTERSARGRLRLRLSRWAMLSSAVVVALASGVFSTTTPRSVARATSMLSTPMPARPTTSRLSATASTRAVIRAALRTITAAQPGTAAQRPSSSRPILTSTSRSGWASRWAMPSGAILSATSTRLVMAGQPPGRGFRP